jgi:hydrogenase expression/formation protein HypC
MCLGIPGRVIEIRTEGDLPFGRVDFAGAVKDVCLAYVPDATVGDYVIVHVGFAISRLDEIEARRTLELFAVMGDLIAQELASDVEPERRT